MGSECIKKQLTAAKLIRPQSIVDIVQEFLKLYQFLKKKKPPAPPVIKTAEVKLEVKPDEIKPDTVSKNFKKSPFL